MGDCHLHTHALRRPLAHAAQHLVANADGVDAHVPLLPRGEAWLTVVPDADAAASVFTSMVTDTGWFRYSNTDAETMQAAASILERGINPSQVYDAVYQQKPASEPAGIAALLARVEFHADNRLALVAQPADCYSATHGTDPDPVLDILRSVKSVEVVLFVREMDQGHCKLSARSKSDYNVNQLARQFGGGGHVKASGATIEGDLASVKARLVEAAIQGFEQDA